MRLRRLAKNIKAKMFPVLHFNASVAYRITLDIYSCPKATTLERISWSFVIWNKKVWFDYSKYTRKWRPWIT